MESKEFEWSDELRLEFFYFAYTRSYSETKGSIFEQFKASKERKPLFVTQDGKEVFEGDFFWTVKFNLKEPFRCYASHGKEDGWIDFSTREAAETYISENAKLYSIKDVREAVISIPGLSYVMGNLISELQKRK